MKKSLLSLRNGAVALAGVAIIFLIAAVLSATVFKPAARVEATLDAARAKSPLLITAPGVLNILPGEVVATVTVPEGEQVAVAVGRTADVDGWSSQYSVVEVTGLVDWSTLDSVNLEPNPEAATVAPSESASPVASAAASAAASGAPTASASPAASAAASGSAGPTALVSGSASPAASASVEETGSAQLGATDLDTASLQAALVANDMWTMAESGTGKVTLKFAPQTDNTSLIAVGSKTAPTLTLSWVSPERSTFLLPGLLWALLFLALAAGLYFFDTAYRREEERRREAAEKRAAKRAATTQLMRAIDPNTERPLSRRELARLESGEGGENGEAGKTDLFTLLKSAGAAIAGFAVSLWAGAKREPKQEQPEGPAPQAEGEDGVATEAAVAQSATGAGASTAEEAKSAESAVERQPAQAPKQAEQDAPASQQAQLEGEAALRASDDAAAEAVAADHAEASGETGQDVVHANAAQSGVGETGGWNEDESPVAAWADPDDPVTPVHPFFAPVAQELFPLGGEEDVEFAPVVAPEETSGNAQDEEEH